MSKLDKACKELARRSGAEDVIEYYLFYDGSIKQVKDEQGAPIHYGCHPIAVLTEQARAIIKRLLKQRKEAGLPMASSGEWTLDQARFAGVSGIKLYH